MSNKMAHTKGIQIGSNVSTSLILYHELGRIYSCEQIIGENEDCVMIDSCND